MISIKCIGGPHNGVVRTPPSNVKPFGLLRDMVDNGWGWEIDFSQASREETIAWGGGDLMARAYRAVKNRRIVNFLGTEYTSVGELQAFEDALVNSGYDVQVEHDDESGLQINIVQPE